MPIENLDKSNEDKNNTLRNEIQALKDAEEANLNEQGERLQAHFQDVNVPELDEKDFELYEKFKTQSLTLEDIEARREQFKYSCNQSQKEFLGYLANQFQIQNWENLSRY